MKASPFPDEFARGRGPNRTHERPPGEVEARDVSLVLRVEVPRVMIVEVHSNDDAKEGGDDRHGSMLPNSRSTRPAGLRFTGANRDAMIEQFGKQKRSGSRPVG